VRCKEGQCAPTHRRTAPALRAHHGVIGKRTTNNKKAPRLTQTPHEAAPPIPAPAPLIRTGAVRCPCPAPVLEPPVLSADTGPPPRIRRKPNLRPPQHPIRTGAVRCHWMETPPPQLPAERRTPHHPVEQWQPSGLQGGQVPLKFIAACPSVSDTAVDVCWCCDHESTHDHC
jgi:hypothetical protein